MTTQMYICLGLFVFLIGGYVFAKKLHTTNGVVATTEGNGVATVSSRGFHVGSDDHLRATRGGEEGSPRGFQQGVRQGHRVLCRTRGIDTLEDKFLNLTEILRAGGVRDANHSGGRRASASRHNFFGFMVMYAFQFG